MVFPELTYQINDSYMNPSVIGRLMASPKMSVSNF